MHFIQPIFLYLMMGFFSGDPVLENPPSSSPTDVEPVATNILLQSKDGGETWHDISYSLPENEHVQEFFAGPSYLYARIKNEMYRSKSNLKTPVWEKVKDLDPRCSSIAFNRSGTTAFSYEGRFLQTRPSTGSWVPLYEDLKKPRVRMVFETSDGAVFLGSDDGLFKSVDKGRGWEQVISAGWVMELVESDGVLIGTHQNGIIRSTDKGETWEWVINEGGVGIAIERIDGGFAAISCNTTTISRRIHISFDSGKSWKNIDAGLEPSLLITSIKQAGQYLICGHPDGIFRSSNLGKTWINVRPSDDGNVYKIHASGGIVYAVGGKRGC